MPKIRDESYQKFLKSGLIDLIPGSEFASMIKKVEHKTQDQARALVILLYITGCRPVEAIDLNPENFDKKGKKIELTIPTKKGGRARILFLPENKYTLELYNYSKKFPVGFFLFYSFRSKARNWVTWDTKKGRKNKAYVRTNTKIRHWFKKWFNVTPYFFRHNRFSAMAMQGASMQEIASVKGAKDLKSVMPYLHLSTKQAKKMSKYFQVKE